MDKETRVFLEMVIKRITAELEKTQPIVRSGSHEQTSVLSRRTVDLDLGEGESIMVSLWRMKK